MERLSFPTALVLLGLPGSGKGTLASYFKQQGHLVLTMSEILDEKAKSDQNLSLNLNISFKKCDGSLVHDEFVFSSFVWKMGLISKSSNIVLDGCVRTTRQVVDVVKHLKENYHIIFIYVNCSRRTSFSRINNRVKESIMDGVEIRSDDRDPVVIARRHDIFISSIEPICDKINQLGFPVHEINGEVDKKAVVSQAVRIFSMISL